MGLDGREPVLGLDGRDPVLGLDGRDPVLGREAALPCPPGDAPGHARQGQLGESARRRPSLGRARGVSGPAPPLGSV